MNTTSPKQILGLALSLILLTSVATPAMGIVTTETADCLGNGPGHEVALFCQPYFALATLDYFVLFDFDPALDTEGPGADPGLNADSPTDSEPSASTGGATLGARATYTITATLHDFEGDAKSFPSDLDLTNLTIVAADGEHGFSGTLGAASNIMVFDLSYSDLAGISLDEPWTIRVESEYSEFIPMVPTEAYSYYSSEAQAVYEAAPVATPADLLDFRPTEVQFLPDTTAPGIEDETDGSAAVTGGSVTFSAEVTDNVEVASVAVNYTVAGPDGNDPEVELPMTAAGNIYSVDVTLPEYAVSVSYDIIAADSAGNVADLSDDFPVEDTIAPTLHRVGTLPDDDYLVGNFTLFADVTDNIGITHVNFTFDGNLHNATLNATTGLWEAAVGNLTDGLSEVEFQAADAAGHAITDTFDVFVDNSPPEIVLDIDPSEPAGDLGWHLANVTISATAVDPHSGITAGALNLTINGVNTTYVDSVVLSDGRYNVSANVVNKAGLFNSTDMVHVKVDTTPPVTVHNATEFDDDPANIYHEDVTVGLNVTEDGSGLNQTFYRVYDGEPGDFVNYTQPFILGDGIWTLEFYSIDMAGNVESNLPVQIAVDTAGPSVVANVTPEAAESGWILNDTAHVELIFKDTVEVDLKKFNLTKPDDESNPDEYSDYMGSFELGQGIHTIYYYGTDISGKVATGNLTIGVDNVAPHTYHQLQAGDAPVDQNGTALESVEIILSATDDVSDVALIEYRLWASGQERGDFVAYDGPVNATGAGSYSLQYRALDKAGNVELPKQIAFSIDLAGPEISPTLDGTPGTDGWFLSDVTVTLHATDDLSAPENITITYRIGDGANETYDGPFTVGDTGPTQIGIWATDEAGNVTQVLLDFSIDLEKPTLIPIVEPTPGSWVQDGTVHYEAMDSFGNAIVPSICYDIGCTDGHSKVMLEDGIHDIEIRATAVSGQTESLNISDIKVDSIASEVSIDAPEGWTNADPAAVAISAADTNGAAESSGVDFIEYTINNGTPITVMDDTVEIDDLPEGVWEINATAFDNAGNEAEEVTAVVQVDRTLPTAQDLSAEDARTGQSFLFMVDAEDALSGIASISAVYDFGDGSSTLLLADGTGSVPVPDDALELFYTIIVKDAAGNELALDEVQIPVVDGYDPEVVLEIAGTSVEDHLVGELALTATATDNIGVVNVTFFDGDTEIGVDEDGSDGWSIEVTPEGEGSREFRAVAVDAAGNSAEHSLAVDVDNKAPSTSATGPTDWVKTLDKAKVTLAATDAGTGVDKTQFRSWCGETEPETYSDYADPIEITQDGTCTVKYRSIDKAGHEESSKSATVKLDRAAPTVAFDGDAPTQAIPSEEVTIVATASDALSGIAKVVLVRSDGETAMTLEGGKYSITITAPADDTSLQYRVRAYDVAGNMAQTSFTTLVVNDFAKDAADLTSKVASSLAVAVTGDNMTATLSWDAQEGASGYQIWRSNSPFVLVADVPATQTSYEDDDALDGSVYVITAYVTADGVDYGKASSNPEANIPNFDSLGRVTAFEKTTSVTEGDEPIPLVVLKNSGQEAVTYTVQVQVKDKDGNEIRNKTVVVTVQPGATETVDLNEDGLLDDGASYDVTASDGTQSESLYAGNLVVPAGDSIATQPLFWMGLLAMIAIVGVVAVSAGSFVSARRGHAA